MKTLLLTGASGFIGAELKQAYKRDGWRVLTMGRREDDDFTFSNETFSTIPHIEVEAKIDRVIHAAAINETLIQDDLTHSYTINVTMTRLLLQLCIAHQITEFIYFSTFHVYGVTNGLLNENSCCKPLNDYGLTHYLSELIIESLCSRNRILYLIVRPTNVYGVPASLATFNRWELVPFQFVRSAILENKITLTSSGTQLRNFVSIKDVIKATELIGQCQVVNAFGIETLSIKTFAQLVAKTLNKAESIVSWLDEFENDSNDYNLILTNSSDIYQPQHCLEPFIKDLANAIVNDD